MEQHGFISENTKQYEWLNYQNIMVIRDKAGVVDKKEPQLITDFMDYNSSSSDYPEYSRLNWAGDLMLECKLTVREPYGDGPIQRFLADAARRHKVWVIGGTLPLTAPEETRVLNTTLVFDPQGREAARHIEG